MFKSTGPASPTKLSKIVATVSASVCNMDWKSLEQMPWVERSTFADARATSATTAAVLNFRDPASGAINDEIPPIPSIGTVTDANFGDHFSSRDCGGGVK